MTSSSTARRNANRGKRIVSALDALVASLPNDQERAQAKATLDRLIEFLESARRALGALPTEGDLASLRSTVGELNRLFERAVTSPIVSSALGLEPARAAGFRPPSIRASAPPAEELERFTSLTIDQMRVLLNDENQYTISKLHQLAKALGARVNSRLGREALANQILTKVTNLRGYRQLSSSGEGIPDSPVPES